MALSHNEVSGWEPDPSTPLPRSGSQVTPIEAYLDNPSQESSAVVCTDLPHDEIYRTVSHQHVLER